jgi:GT2 family glycosyltransferase
MNSCSIVLYNNDISEINQCIYSIKNSTINLKIYLIDNSENEKLNIFSALPSLIYIKTSHNIGFGAAHNIAIKDSIKNNFKYHFIINPDIKFESNVMKEMINYMSLSENIAAMMPKVLNTDGTTQYNQKLIPTPLTIIFKKLKLNYIIRNNNLYNDLHDLDNQILNIPTLSGCFLLFDLSKIKKVGLFDEIFFLYFEDWDISRRIHLYFDTIYYPKVYVTHTHFSGANKNFALFYLFIKSYVHYFNKWGWFNFLNIKKYNSITNILK